MIIPPTLPQGSKIRIVLPSAVGVESHDLVRKYRNGLNLLRQYYQVEDSLLAAQLQSGASLPDDERARELLAAYRDPDVAAVICGLGSHGSMRLLSQLDYDIIASQPKILIGSGDISALHLTIYRHTEQVGFSGPNVGDLTDDNLKLLQRVTSEGVVDLDLISEESRSQIEVLQEGRAEGTLLGGNLRVISNLIGTAYLPRFVNTVLLLEISEGDADEIDNYLQHLKLSGLLYDVVAVVIGLVGWHRQLSSAERKKHQAAWEGRLRDFFRQETPVIANFNYGAVTNCATLPIGAQVCLDTESPSLVLKEAVVRV